MSTALIAVALIAAIAYLMGNFTGHAWSFRTVSVTITTCLLLLWVLFGVLTTHEKQVMCPSVPVDKTPSLKKGVQL